MKLVETKKGDYKKVLLDIEKFITLKKNIVYKRFMFYFRKPEEKERNLIYCPVSNEDIKDTVRRCAKVRKKYRSSNTKEPKILEEFSKVTFEYGGQSHIAVIDYFPSG